MYTEESIASTLFATRPLRTDGRHKGYTDSSVDTIPDGLATDFNLPFSLTLKTNYNEEMLL